jgi:phytoene synthase
MSEAEQITKKSRSNLAFAFFSLPPERRRDISIFYAFCRRVDDAADNPGVPMQQRRSWLRRWRSWLREPEGGEPALAAEVRTVIRKYQIDLHHLDDILDGVEMDLDPVRFSTFKELEAYCYRVASAVGLVSIEIFGYRNPLCRQYAYSLGQALQLTNIIRDVNTDYQHGQRIYLPLDELNRFGYFELQLRARIYNDQFVELMQCQAERAHAYFRQARSLLPSEDRRSMIAAEGMKGIYYALLRRMERDRFRVFQKKYGLGKARKLMIILREFASNRFAVNELRKRKRE